MIWQKFTNDIEGASGRDGWRRSDSGGGNGSWSGCEKYMSRSAGHCTSFSGGGREDGGCENSSDSGKRAHLTSGSGNMEKRW